VLERARAAAARPSLLGLSWRREFADGIALNDHMLASAGWRPCLSLRHRRMPPTKQPNDVLPAGLTPITTTSHQPEF